MSNMIETLNQILKDGINRGLALNFTEDQELTGKTVTIDGQELTNFGSCSYLGLEMHEALKEGVIQAVQKYGTQFSSSRTYLSLGLYQELEDQLRDIFQKPLAVTASTTLGHFAALPVVVGDNDAIILDLQVHSSIQLATQVLKAKKVPVYIIQHNDIEGLEKKIKHLSNKHDKVWYMADGVYSMYGDFAPFDDLQRLLDTYKKFHLYIDDAHGMSWTGDKGVGVVRSHMPHHDKMVLAVSLNKSFACAGGAIVFPNKEIEAKVRNCGSTLIFSGPIQPPMLGAAIASAELHRTNALKAQQDYVQELINYTNQRLKEYDLPQFMETDSPIFFIPAGLPRISYAINQRMKKDGFYLNTAAFPAVPMKKSGIRFMVNGHLSKADIDKMLEALKKNYALTLHLEGSSCEEVASVFRIPEFYVVVDQQHFNQKNKKAGLQLTINRSILDESREEWDAYFALQGNLNYNNLKAIEKLFKNRTQPEEQWDFYYCTIRDQQGKIVLKTFYTCAMVKDDMFSSAKVSEKVEKERLENSYYLTSKNIMTGSLITKGKHLHLDYQHKKWQEALRLLVEAMQETQEERGATKIMIRDFDETDREVLNQVMLETGLVEMPLLNNCVVPNVNWDTQDDHLMSLSGKYRYNVRKEIIKYENRFTFDYNKPSTELEIKQAYALYKQVFKGAYELNVFPLPYAFFRMMCQDDNYDVIRMYLNGEHTESGQPELCAVMFSHIHQSNYNALIVGLDYRYVRKHNSYKQILYKTIWRAKDRACQKLDLAYTAELEKKKIGAEVQAVYAYVQAVEHYSHTVLEAMV